MAGTPAKPAKKPRPPKPVIGWREIVDLPELGLTGEIAKIDTGARTSSLHVDRIEPFTANDGTQRAIITVVRRRPGEPRRTLRWDLEIREFRDVRSSNGAVEERAVILTTLIIGGKAVTREFTLSNRKKMSHEILIGRRGIGRLFTVDPARTFLLGKNPAKANGQEADN